MSSPPIPNFQPDCIQRDKKLCQNERIPTKVYDNSSLASIAAAQEIIDLINEKDGHVVLGLATGSTPTAVYKELIQAYKKGEVSFENVITFNLDEYYPILPTQNQSYHLFMNKVLFDHINIKKKKIFIYLMDQ
ncbi:6-phosphogluconolactonase [Entamoeba marina]